MNIILHPNGSIHKIHCDYLVSLDADELLDTQCVVDIFTSRLSGNINSQFSICYNEIIIFNSEVIIFNSTVQPHTHYKSNVIITYTRCTSIPTFYIYISKYSPHDLLPIINSVISNCNQFLALKDF